MSFGNGEKPPVNAKYDAAIKRQRKGGSGGSGGKAPPKYEFTPARQFLFMGNTADNIPVVFVCYGEDNRAAISNAVAYCIVKGYTYAGWMPYRKSAYMRLV